MGSRELREALEMVEWVEAESGPGMMDLMCPWCEGWKPKHAKDCDRQRALAATEEPAVSHEARPRDGQANSGGGLILSPEEVEELREDPRLIHLYDARRIVALLLARQEAREETEEPGLVTHRADCSYCDHGLLYRCSCYRQKARA